MTESDRSEAMRRAARDALRELIPDLMHEALGDASASANGHSANGHAANGHSSNGHGAPAATAGEHVVPMVPAPPLAAVLRPSTWSAPAAPGEVIGDADMIKPAVAPPPPGGATARPAALSTSTPRAPAEAGPGAGSGEVDDQTVASVRVEIVTIDDDEQLEAFVRALAGRLENPRDRLAIKAGQLRFKLRRTAAAGTSGGAEAETVRIEKGAVTERTVQDAAGRGARLVLARRAVLTPLARDKARVLGVRIEREGRC
jgi:hypothetical protein